MSWLPYTCRKKAQRGSQVCWRSFAAAPLYVYSQSYQGLHKVNFKSNGMFPIRHAKEPLCKGLEANLATDPLQH